MGGLSIDWNRLREDAMQTACEFWHELTGGELYFYIQPSPYAPDLFERMEIANRSGATFRG